jgi:hypothetical protein
VAVAAFGPNPDGAGTVLRLWEQGEVGGELGEKAGGIDYTGVSMAVKRMEKRSLKDPSLRKTMRKLNAICEM